MYTVAGERAEGLTIHYTVTNLSSYFQQHASPFSFSIAAGVSNPHDFWGSNVALLLIVSLSSPWYLVFSAWLIPPPAFLNVY